MKRSPLRAAVDAGFVSAPSVEAAEREHGGDAARHLLNSGDLTDTQYEACRTVCGERVVAPGYDVTGILGIGGMGVVYRAVQHALGREVALKTIGVSHSDGEAVRRFEREAKVLARVQHPNVVAAYDFGRHDGRLFLAMELAEGVDFRTAMARRQFSEAEVWSIIRQAACGLSAACKAGVVHRDVKPANLLLTEAGVDGGVPLTKVADFGVATLVGGSDDRITSTNVTVGSPAYLAPELFAGGEPSERSDIYSLGATACHALAGVPPFHGLSLPALIAAKATDEVSVPDTVSDGSRRLIGKMTARRPAKRPVTFSECVDLIDSLAPKAHAPRSVLVGDADASTTTQITATKRSRRWPLVVPAAVTALLIGAFYITRPDAPSTVYTPADAGMLLFDGQSIADWNAAGQWEIGENSEGTASIIGRSGSALRRLPPKIVSETTDDGASRLFPYRLRSVLERTDGATVAVTFRPQTPGETADPATHLILEGSSWRVTQGTDAFESEIVAEGDAVAATSPVAVSIDHLLREWVVRLNGTTVWRGDSDVEFPRAVRFSVRGGSLVITEPSVVRLVPGPPR